VEGLGGKVIQKGGGRLWVKRTHKGRGSTSKGNSSSKSWGREGPSALLEAVCGDHRAGSNEYSSGSGKVTGIRMVNRKGGDGAWEDSIR